jgi:hypothetical protein
VKISWGIGITITIIVFMLISFWLIYFSFSQEVNLVRDDYYQAEVQFDNKLESINRTEKLDEKLLISLEGKNIKLLFPSNFSNNDINGSVFLYRPSNRESDIQLPINLDSTNIQIIGTTGMLNGMWKIQVSWRVDSLEYFSEKNIMVQ